MFMSVKDLLIEDWLKLREYLDIDSPWIVSREGMIDQAAAELIAMAVWSEKEELASPQQCWPYSASEKELRSYLNNMTQGKKQKILSEMSHEELCSVICNMH